MEEVVDGAYVCGYAHEAQEDIRELHIGALTIGKVFTGRLFDMVPRSDRRFVCLAR